MARWSSSQKAPRQRGAEALPSPLPPETRTVGQLVAETIKLYGRAFWRALPLGIPLAALDFVAYGHGADAQTVLLWAFGPLLAAAYVWASSLVTGARLERRTALTAFLVGLVVFIPFPVLFRIFVLPGLAVFAMFGLAVPAAVVERLDVRAALRRGFELARADTVHALGGLATLAIVYGVSRLALQVLLHTQGSQAERGAAVLADLVLGPIVFLGGAFLYFDQKARLELRAAQPESPSASHSRR